MNHSLYQDGILKALPFKRLPCRFDAPGTGTVTAIRPVSPETCDSPWVAGFAGAVDGCA
jgi:hypothetical protein